MYQYNLKVLIVSPDPLWEKAMTLAQTPKRFTLSFKTQARPEPALWKTASFIIVDDPTPEILTGLRSECQKDAVLIAAVQQDLPQTDWAALCQSFDEVWRKPMPQPLILQAFQRWLDYLKTRKELWLTENYLESTINSIPDLVWFKDLHGAHLKVNNAFCQAVGKTKDDIVGRGHYYIWDLKQEEYEKGEYVCLETEEQVLKARKTCLFDEKVKSKHGLRQFKTYKSPIFGDDGEPIGTVGIAHDVTDLENMGTEMAIILRSMPFSILVKNSDNVIINTNERFEHYFGITHDEIVGQDYDVWQAQTLLRIQASEKAEFQEALIQHEKEERLLEIREEPIYDIFMNLAGKLYIFRDITRQRQMEQQILYNSNTDFLTGLYNRRHFYEYLAQNRGQQHVSLIYADLDYFKLLNDTQGHQAGDEALVLTAVLLKQCFPDAFLTRLGGDEFLILYLGNWALTELTARSQTFLRKMEEQFRSRFIHPSLTASIGIAQTDDPQLSVDKLMQRSDQALYQAKQQGRNQVRVYGESGSPQAAVESARGLFGI